MSKEKAQPKEPTVKDAAVNGPENKTLTDNDNCQPLEETTPKESTESACELDLADNNTNQTPSPEASNPPLRDDVTIEPQEKWHLPLDTVEKMAGETDSYMNVTDDRGALLGNQELYDRTLDLTNLEISSTMEHAQEILKDATETLKNYFGTLTFLIGVLSGKICFYKIIGGLALNKIQEIFNVVRKNAPDSIDPSCNEHENNITRKTKWGDWVSHEFGIKKSERYIQICKQLTQAEDALEHSFLDEGRIISLIRVGKDARSKKDDPILIGQLIQEYGIEFDLSDDPNPTKDQLTQIDYISFHNGMGKMAQLYGFERYEDLDLNYDGVIKAIKRKPKAFTKNEMKELCIIKKNGGDPNNHLEDILNNTGNREGLEELDFENGLRALKPLLKQVESLCPNQNMSEIDLRVDEEYYRVIQSLAENLTTLAATVEIITTDE